MVTRRRSGGAAAAAVVTAAVATVIVNPTAAVAAPQPDYPTWQDVQNARKSEAAKKAEISQIEGILVGLEAQAAELGKIAQVKSEQYAQAQDALATATKKLDSLKTQASDAQDRADVSGARAARLIAQLARTGGGDVTMSLMLSSTSDADKLLSRLSSASKLSESSAAILDRAVFDRNQAQSLADDAAAAEKVRKKLAKTAQDAMAAAKAASDQAAAQVAAQQAAASQMYAQLAALKGTTAAVEQSYQEGLTEAQEAAQSAAPPPSSPPSGVDPTPNVPVAGAVAQAIAYARAQVGEPYAFGGAGPSVWDCSGLTKMAYASAGVYIGSHSVSNQYATMRSQGRLVSINSLQPGDLLFYSSGGSTSGGFYHVTIYIGGGQMIEAPRPGVNVRVAPLRYGDLVPYAGRPTG